jgi:hypothetical protein
MIAGALENAPGILDEWANRLARFALGRMRTTSMRVMGLRSATGL